MRQILSKQVLADQGSFSASSQTQLSVAAGHTPIFAVARDCQQNCCISNPFAVAAVVCVKPLPAPARFRGFVSKRKGAEETVDGHLEDQLSPCCYRGSEFASLDDIASPPSKAQYDQLSGILG